MEFYSRKIFVHYFRFAPNEHWMTASEKVIDAKHIIYYLHSNSYANGNREVFFRFLFVSCDARGRDISICTFIIIARCIGASTFTFQIKRGKKLEQIPIIHNKIAEELLHLFSFWINKMSKFSERRSIDSWPKIVNRRCQHELIFNMWSNACRIHANKCRWRTHRMQFSKQFQTMFEIPIFKSSRLYTQLNVKPQKLLNYRLHGICVSFMLRSIRRSTIQQSICVLRNTFASEWHGASLARPVKCSSFN